MSDLSASEFDWDFFLAHASPDAAAAGHLYDVLAEGNAARVFLDSRSLQLGDDWDVRLAEAQRKSRVTVVLVSGHTENAYYQREEVAAAIAMAREDGQRHRVVPLFIGELNAEATIPYGLRLKHGLHVAGPGEMSSAAISLLGLLDDINTIPAHILTARTSAAEGAGGGNALSLKTLADSTSSGASAIHAFVMVMEEMVRSGARTLDFLADHRERARLRRLLQRLMRIEHSQAPLPWLLRGYRQRRARVNDWARIMMMVASLTPDVAKVTELLAATNGPFMVTAHDAYKSLLFSLRSRSEVYASMAAIGPPTSDDDFAYLETIAAQYEVMIADLKRAEVAIARYLAD